MSGMSMWWQGEAGDSGRETDKGRKEGRMYRFLDGREMTQKV